MELRPTDVERLILKNQYAILDILARAFPHLTTEGSVTIYDADYYRQAQEVLERGDELLLSYLDNEIREKTLSKEEQIEIIDILEMYVDLQHSFDKLEGNTTIRGDALEFDGWDGNSSKGELWFARAFCFEDGEDERPTRFATVRPSPAYNSHSEVLPAYRRMLKVYNSIRKGQGRLTPMTEQQLQQVLSETVHPNNR